MLDDVRNMAKKIGRSKR